MAATEKKTSLSELIDPRVSRITHIFKALARLMIIVHTIIC